MTEHSQPSAGGSFRSTWRPVLWRGVPILAAFLCAWIGLLAGAGVSERDLLGAGAAERAYYALESIWSDAPRVEID